MWLQCFSTVKPKKKKLHKKLSWVYLYCFVLFCFSIYLSLCVYFLLSHKIVAGWNSRVRKEQLDSTFLGFYNFMSISSHTRAAAGAGFKRQEKESVSALLLVPF